MLTLLQDVEFSVRNVQVRAGYVLHIGVMEGVLRTGDIVQLNIDEVRCSSTSFHRFLALIKRIFLFKNVFSLWIEICLKLTKCYKSTK